MISQSQRNWLLVGDASRGWGSVAMAVWYLPDQAYADIKRTLEQLDADDQPRARGELLEALERLKRDRNGLLGPRPPVDGIIAVDSAQGHHIYAFMSLTEEALVLLHVVAIPLGTSYQARVEVAWEFARRRYLEGGY